MEAVMDIVGLNIENADFCDIDSEFRSLVEHEDRFAAAKGRMLQELVQYLRKTAPKPRLVGHLLFDELHLWRLDQDPKRGSVRMCVDWYDYGQWDGDLPVMHFRVKVPEQSEDVRTREPAEVERLLRRAFG
jgi:hypothetical protein